MTTTHTPGPWKALIDWPTAPWPGHLVKACNDLESPLCAVPRAGNGNSEADTHLIAAAPDLLAALREACIAHHSANGTKPPESWRLAVAKAEGRLEARSQKR